MRRTTFTMLILVLALGLFCASAVHAKKPQEPPAERTFTRYCCYARFEEGQYAITSDGLGTYDDLSISGSDKIQVESYDDNGELKFLRVYIGKPEEPYRGNRRVKLNFDFLNDATQKPGLNTAVFDSLAWLWAGGSRRGNASNGDYYINDGTAHLLIQFDDGSCRTGILIDEGCVGDINSAPPPITQTTVDAFYNDSDPQYWTPVQASIETGDPNMIKEDGSLMTKEETDPHDQVAYFLYVNQLNFTVTKKDSLDKPCEWTITPKSSKKLKTTNLYVVDSENTGYINLATYPILDFKLVVSRIPFNAAPSKERTSATFWGEIKSSQ